MLRSIRVFFHFLILILILFAPFGLFAVWWTLFRGWIQWEALLSLGVIAVAVSFIYLWFSEILSLFILGSFRRVDQSDDFIDQELQRQIEKVQRDFNLDFVPKIWIKNDPRPEVFILRGIFSGGGIAVTDAFLKNLNSDDFEKLILNSIEWVREPGVRLRTFTYPLSVAVGEPHFGSREKKMSSSWSSLLWKVVTLPIRDWLVVVRGMTQTKQVFSIL